MLKDYPYICNMRITTTTRTAQISKSFFNKVVNQMFTTASVSTTLAKAEKEYPSNWWTKYSMTAAQKKTFRVYFQKEGRRDFGWNNTRAYTEFLRWFQDWGLRVVG